SAGDKAEVLYHPSSGPAPNVSPLVSHSTVFRPTTPNRTILSASNQPTTFSNSAAQAIMPFAAMTPAAISGTSRRSFRLPDGGTLRNLYVDSTTPGGAASYDYTVYTNGATTGITTNIAASATAGNDTTHTASPAAGDDIQFNATPSGTPTASTAVFGVSWTPTTASHFPIGGSESSGTDSTTQQQFYPPTTGGSFTPTTTEANIQQIAHAMT